MRAASRAKESLPNAPLWRMLVDDIHKLFKHQKVLVVYADTRSGKDFAAEQPTMVTLTKRDEQLLTRINAKVAKQRTFNGRMKFRVLAGCFRQFAPVEHIGEPVICEKGDTTNEIVKP